VEAHWSFPIWPPLCPTLYLSRHLRYLMWKLCDVDLGRFNVTQGQRWWCQSTAHGWRPPIRLLLTITSYLSPFLKYLTFNVDDLELGQLRSSKVKGHGVNRKPKGDFLFDFYWPQHRICHHFWNIWRVILMNLNWDSSNLVHFSSTKL